MKVICINSLNQKGLVVGGTYTVIGDLKCICGRGGAHYLLAEVERIRRHRIGFFTCKLCGRIADHPLIRRHPAFRQSRFIPRDPLPGVVTSTREEALA